MKQIDVTVQSESHWTSATDLMSGLMLIFMFIAVVYMINTSSERDEMRKVAKEWAQTKHNIYKALETEFKDDLPKWNAEIEKKTLLVRFREPKVLFKSNSSALTAKFMDILSNFFPRYIKVLNEFKDSISEIRIEGHTSSEWNESTTGLDAYFKNMELSQDRTRTVLEYCLPKATSKNAMQWAKDLLIAAGMSSSRLVMINHKEDCKSSRRVEFRVRTKADEKLSLILQTSDSPAELQIRNATYGMHNQANAPDATGAR
jgi:outer membrane protein OmpA-like peptidoglycan-associated protein